MECAYKARLFCQYALKKLPGFVLGRRRFWAPTTRAPAQQKLTQDDLLKFDFQGAGDPACISPIVMHKLKPVFFPSHPTPISGWRL